jgi:N4-gp56 family major capsid protein
MAESRAATGLTVQHWDSAFFTQYLQENRFTPYMGDKNNSLIQVNKDLRNVKGKTVTFALANKLIGAGVTGSATLEGAEEDLRTRSFTVNVDKRRHAVIVPEIEEQYSAIGLRDAGREVLMDWMMENVRNRMIAALGSINGVAYDSASAWLVNNSDRVLYGNAKGNSSSGVHATALATVDNTNDKLTTASIDLMKRMALEASPKIRPIRVGNDTRSFVLFCGTRTFRDLKRDTVLMQAQRDALPRSKDNPLFRGGDLLWDNVVIHEIDDIPVYTGVGAGSIDVSPVYFCGAQALAYAIAKPTYTITDERDYKDKQGVSVNIIDGVEKMRFGTSATTDTGNTKDNGLLTGFFAAVADA